MTIGLPLASSILTAVGSAMAQQTTDQNGLEEIVVTAEKRTETLQNVPMSIQAITTEKLEELHVESFDDYVKYLPSVSFQSHGGSGFEQVFMRGVNADNNPNHSGPLPTVGMYLDEQPITTIQGALNIHIYDIARVEALAGPQGTLYGASSEAGTIRIITNKPDPSGFAADYDVQGDFVDHGDFGYIAEGMVNEPLSSNIAIRLVGWDEHDAGFIDDPRSQRTFPTAGITINNYAIAKKAINDSDTVGGRGAMKFNFGDSWTITPTVMGQEVTSYGNSSTYAGLPWLDTQRYVPEKGTDHWAQGALTIEGKISNIDLVYAGSYLKRDDTTILDYSDYSLAYDVTSGILIYGAGGPTAAPINPTQIIYGTDRYTKLSHELRFSTPKDLPVRFIGGVFLQHQIHNIEQNYVIPGLEQSDWVSPSWPDTWWLTLQQRVDRDTAEFGELSWDIIPSLTATAGIRFFKADNSLEGFYGYGATNYYFGIDGAFGSNSGPGPAYCPVPLQPFSGAPCLEFNKDVVTSGSTPKFNLTYHINDDAMIYGTLAKGFRPGGVNRAGLLPGYQPDYLTSYELGWKTSWVGNRVHFNGAFFLEDWTNFQFSFLGANSLTQVVNSPRAQIPGMETNIDWAATSQLTLSTGFTVMDPHLTADYCGRVNQTTAQVITSCPVGSTIGGWTFTNGPATYGAPSGTQLPSTPKFKGNVIARYAFDLAGMPAHVQGSYEYQAAEWADLRIVQRSELGQQPAYGTMDLTAGIDEKGWTAELFIKNALNTHGQEYRYVECGNDCTGDAQQYDLVHIYPTQPLTIGVKFGQKF
jgi:iron complex outermembrane recepter protein